MILLRRVLCFLFLLPLFLGFFTSFVQAQDLGNRLFNLGSYPVDYDPPLTLGRGVPEPYSIDACLDRKEFHYNELFNVWVDGLVRCRYNAKGVLSKATINGISTKPEDEQACKNLREGQIIVNGTPSEDRARDWSEHCSYLGTLGGAGPKTKPSLTPGTPTSLGGKSLGTPTTSGGAGTTPRLGGPEPGIASMSDDQLIKYLREKGLLTGQESDEERRNALNIARGKTGDSAFQPVYSGLGVQVPPSNLVPSGISKEKSLIQLLVFYTNATLPYVSVVSVLAFVSAGLFYILSFTNEELNGKAKNMMYYVVIGIIIIFSAYTIVNTLLKFSDVQ